MMRLPKFRYRAPRTIEDAVAWLGENPETTMILAGGTDILPNMKRRQQVPTTLVALRGLSDPLRNIRIGSDVTIGASVTLSEIVASAQLHQSYRGLWQAASLVATPHLRNMATLGGNVCLDTRCTYYDQTHEWRKAINFCMKKDGDTCWVATSSPKCLAVSSTDTAPVLQALGAIVTLVSTRGERRVPIADLYANDGMHYLTKQRDELLTEITLPNAGEWRTAYWKLRRRGSFDFPAAGAAVAVKFDGPRVIDARIVLGAVGSRPVAADRATELLKNQALSDEVIESVAAAANEPAKPMDNTDFELVWRKKMASALVKDALREVRGDDMRARRKQLARQELLLYPSVS